MKADHLATAQEQVNTLEKTISGQTLELRATQDDLNKAKAALAASVPELEALKAQLAEANQSAETVTAAVSSEHIAEVQRLKQELAIVRDDLSATQDALKVTKESMEGMSQHHTIELELAAKARAEEVTNVRGSYEEEKVALLADRDMLTSRLSDLEGELATLKASASTVRSPSPKSNGAAHSQSQSISKEELQRLHEAHNLKLGDVEAAHGKALKNLHDELESVQSRADELQAEIGRKTMEIQYLEQDSEEKDDTITRYVRSMKFISSRTFLLRFNRACDYLKTVWH